VTGRGTESCPEVKLNISCNLIVKEKIIGIKAELECKAKSDNPRVVPNIQGWTRSGIPIDKENHVYHIVPYNNLREELIILNYTSASAGTYGCIIGVGENKTVCTTILEGILLMYSIV
jgi:hypothetical protein